jgi:6-phosphogluconate dehydrogenase
MTIAIIGLGKMGSRIATKLHDENHQVFVWNRSWETTEKFLARAFNSPQSGFPRSFKTIQDLVLNLPTPRVFWLMLPSGEPTQAVINELSKYLQKGDIVVDGGNAHFKDTEKRFQKFKKMGIEFLGVGVSGGIVAAKNGYPLMVGGSKKAYLKIKPILDSLSKPNGGHQYLGEGGAGHFVKMVHNGIEYGIMQSLGEGFEVLEKSKYEFNLLDVAKIWQKGTLVSGFMLDRAVDALNQDVKLKNMAGPVSESGEARWTIEEATQEKVEVEIIQASLDYRLRSQKDKRIQNSFTAKMLNGLRSAFGGHEIKGK